MGWLAVLHRTEEASPIGRRQILFSKSFSHEIVKEQTRARQSRSAVCCARPPSEARSLPISLESSAQISTQTMAAILCSSIGAGCTAIGHCLTFPCTACGSCCSTMCSALGRTLTSPFTPYLLTTVVLNVPPVLWGLRTAVEVIRFGTKCQDSIWLYVNACLSFLHLLAAWYIVHRIQQQQTDIPVVHSNEISIAGSSPETPIDPEGVIVVETVAGGGGASAEDCKTPYKSMGQEDTTTTPTWQRMAALFFPGPVKATQAVHAVVVGEGEGEANSWQRLKQVFCYDIGVAVYMVAILFWLTWQSVGISQVLFRNDDNEDNYLCESMEKRTVLSILCGFLYIMLVFVTFACSFVCLK